MSQRLSSRMIRCVCAVSEHGLRRDELVRRFSAATVRAVEARELVGTPVGGICMATRSGQMVAAAMRFCAQLHPEIRERFLSELRF